MSAEVTTASLTSASTSELADGAGGGVWAGGTTVSVFLIGSDCVAGPVLGLFAGVRRGWACAAAAKANVRIKLPTMIQCRLMYQVSPNNCALKTLEVLRSATFIAWSVPNSYCTGDYWTPASFLTVSSVSISAATLSGRSLTMRGKRSAKPL